MVVKQLFDSYYWYNWLEMKDQESCREYTEISISSEIVTSVLLLQVCLWLKETCFSLISYAMFYCILQSFTEQVSCLYDSQEPLTWVLKVNINF